MKKFKKILALALSMAMVLGMSVTSFAAPEKGKKTDTGNIVVHGIEEKNLTNVMAYPIMPAKYDKNDNFVGYDTTIISDPENITEAQLNAIDVTNLGDGFALEYNETDQTYTAVGKPVGMYLIVVPDSNSTTYSKAVASIYYTNTGSDYVINGADLTLNTKVTQTEPWIKKNVDVDVEKKVEGVPGNTANVGDVLNYEVIIPVVPTYNGPHPVLKITDVLSKGLTYQNDAKIYSRVTDKDTGSVTDTEILADKLTSIVKVASVTTPKEGTQLTVDFVETTGTGDDAVSTYLLSGQAGGTVVVKYSAKLNADAQRNGLDNGNSVDLEYTKDSSVKTDDPEGNPKTETETHTYTFDIDGTVDGSITKSIITKYGEEVIGNEKQPLAGAVFTLYKGLDRNASETDKEYLERILVESNIYKNYDSEDGTETPVVVTTNAAGKVKISGLAAGTYYLKETSAPTGYTVNDHAFKIVITATPDEKTGKLAEWSIKIDDKDVAAFSVTNDTVAVKADTKVEGVEIQNTKISSLPSTGGIGTTIFTIGGCAIMILAAALYFASRRKTAK